MGTYIALGTDTVKVTGSLSRVLPDYGSTLNAGDLLETLNTALETMEATSDYQSAYATGMLDYLNDQARTSAFAIPEAGPVRLWFEHRKLEQARELVHTAYRTGQTLTWC